MAASIESKAVQIEPRETIPQIDNTKMSLLAVSGSVCSILNESLARPIVQNSSLA